MGVTSEPSMITLLEEQRALLDKALGAGAYTVASLRPEQATLSSKFLEASFACERDGEIATLLLLHRPPENTSGDADIWLWAKFLGVETAPARTDRDGRVLAAPEEQLRTLIEMIGRLASEVFADPQKLRDAAFFVDGYSHAYNDWASGNW